MADQASARRQHREPADGSRAWDRAGSHSSAKRPRGDRETDDGEGPRPRRDDDEPRKRRRSRSPRPAGRRDEHRHHERRGHGGQRDRDDAGRRQRRRSSTHSQHSLRAPGELPFGARRLNKSSDYEVLRPLFARYLEVQKQIYIGDLDEREARGRWKSFVGKWNGAELAEGWYDPTVWETALEHAAERGEGEDRPTVPRRQVITPPLSGRRVPEGRNAGGPDRTGGSDEDDDQGDEEDDGYGPALPPGDPALAPYGGEAQALAARHGPGIPSLQDLEVQREQAEEDRAERAARLRLERKADRAEQKAKLEELAPRAEAGTRERQLEKKREVNDKMRQFRDRSPGGGAAEVGDRELMGGGDGVDDFRRQKAEVERRKTEREIRREEFQRARMAEREERVREYREKEDSTMAMLKELAKQRFG